MTHRMVDRSILGILGELEARGDELAMMPGTPELTAVHRAALDMMDGMLKLGLMMANGSSNVPPVASALLHTMEAGRPMLAEGLARVPASAIREFLRGMNAQLAEVVDLPLTDDEIEEGARDGGTAAQPGPDPAGVDQSAGAEGIA